MVEDCSSKGDRCIIGDVNCQLGREAGPRGIKWNSNGKKLYKMMQECNLVAADLLDISNGPEYTFLRENIGESYIDHCLLSKYTMLKLVVSLKSTS